MDLDKQNSAFNALMLRWLKFMQKTFPEEECFTNLVRLMTEKSDNPSSPMVYFFNNNIQLQDLIRTCDLDYFDAQPDDESQDIMGSLKISLPSDFKSKVQAIPMDEQTKMWHFMNELLTLALRVHPEYMAKDLPPNPFDRERFPSKLFMTY